MRDTVIAATSLSLSIGGGTSKFVAKLAAGLAKPRPGGAADGVHVVAPGAEAGFIAPIRAGGHPAHRAQVSSSAWRGSASAGTRRGPARAGDLVGWLGEREGTWLHERARGIDRAPVEPNREAKSGEPR